jgi:hypothetical protein
MQNPFITRWELTPIEKFESFLLELINYLKRNLVSYKQQGGKISYKCAKNHVPNDPNYTEPFVRLANFCKEKKLNIQEVLDMIDEYTGEVYDCECMLLRDERIRKLSEKSN